MRYILLHSVYDYVWGLKVYGSIISNSLGFAFRKEFHVGLNKLNEKKEEIWKNKPTILQQRNT